MGDSPCPEEPAAGGTAGQETGAVRVPVSTTKLWGSGTECHFPSVSEDLGMKAERTQPSCISGAFIPPISRPASSVRPNGFTRADFWGKPSDRSPSQQVGGGESSVSLYVEICLLIVLNRRLPVGNTCSSSLPIPLSLPASPRASAASPAPLPVLFSRVPLPLLQGSARIFRGKLP